MPDAVDFSTGGYRFIPSVFQYSGGAAALPGHAIQRVQFRAPVPLAQGFARIERIITDAGRPLTSFCACELRSPAPFTEQGFRAFNEIYVVTLERWGLFDGKVNPVARSNVCPEIDPPAEPSFHAFCFTVADADAAPSVVISGGAEAREGERELSRAHHPLWRHEPRRDPREGVPRARRDGAPAGRARLPLGRHHRDAGLHRARSPSVPRRRDRAARRRPLRA